MNTLPQQPYPLFKKMERFDLSLLYFELPFQIVIFLTNINIYIE